MSGLPLILTHIVSSLDTFRLARARSLFPSEAMHVGIRSVPGLEYWFDLDTIRDEFCKQITARGEPDLTITRHGVPYLERWYVERDEEGCVFLHRFVGPDPDVGPHDHPWDSASLLVAGEQEESWLPDGTDRGPPRRRTLVAGDVIYRPARFAHQLRIAQQGEGPPLTIFVAGPMVREWGFWVDRDGERRLERHPIELQEVTT